MPETTSCTCGSPETYSLNPAEVVVHCTDGPCYIAPATHPDTQHEQEGSER